MPQPETEMLAPPTACELCGKDQSFEMCSVRALMGKCGRSDPRRLTEPINDPQDATYALVARTPEHDPMYSVFAGRLLIRRCGAKTRAGLACKRLPIRGKFRCALHGGKSTGPKPKHGRRSKAARSLVKAAHLSMRLVRLTNRKRTPE